MPHAERDIGERAIDKERRHRANSQLFTAAGVLLHALQVNVIVHLVVVPLHVQPHQRGVLSEMRFLEMTLVPEQCVMERPEEPLSAGRFRRFGSPCGVRVVDLRVMPEHEPHAIAEMVAHHLHRGVRAIQSLERKRRRARLVDQGHRRSPLFAA